MENKLLILCCLLIGICFSCKHIQEQKQEREPITVGVQIIGDEVVHLPNNYVGMVEENSSVSLSFSAGGTVEQVLVKEGDLYYVKTPHKNYHYNRLEVFVKANLKNAVEFAGESYGQGHISASWNDYTNQWLLAADEEQNGESYAWHANDQNGSVYYTGIGFLDSGYGDVNHPYDNGVTSSGGYTHTATQKDNETVTLESGQRIECVVWEYSFTTSDPEVYSHEKFWFEAQTGITIKWSSVLSSSEDQSLDAEENVGFTATYFATNETMESYLRREDVNRWPAPDFSSYR